MAYKPEGPPARGGGRNPGKPASIINYGPMSRKPPKRKPKPKPRPLGKPSGPDNAPDIGRRDPLTELLDSIYGPQQGYLTSQIDSERAAAAQQAQLARAKAEAYAKYFGSHVPGQIQGIYSNAAGQTADFAKGFSDGMKIAQDQTAAEKNAIIGLSGAPAEAQINPTSDASDVLYGIGGFMPASSLAKQGAAFASAAAIMPGAIAAEGGRNAAKIMASAEENIAKLEQELVKLETKKAETGLKLSESRRAEKIKLQLETLKMAADAKKDEQMMAYRWATLDWRQKQDILSNKQAAMRIYQAQQRIGLTEQNQSFNQWYKQQTLAQADARIAQADQRIAQGWLRLQASKKGGAGGKFIDPLTGRPLTDPEVKGYKDDAFDSINDGLKLMKLTPAQIMRDLHKSAIPFEIWAQVAIKRFGIKPMAKNLGKNAISFSNLFRLAAFWGLDPATFPSQGEGDKGVSRRELIAFIKTAQRAASGKGSAAPSGGANTAYLASLWIQAGGDPAVAPTAAAIAMAESGGRVDAWNPKGKDRSAGLWQINYYGDMRKSRTRQFGPPELLRRDPLANARAAVAIYKSAGNSFSPWSTYTSGAYKNHLGGVQAVSYGGGGQAVREMFYDPIGAYDEGSWIKPIGGHSDHVHISFGSPQEALAIMRKARQLGLRVGENPYYDPVERVHTDGSYHYRNFPGQYNGRTLGMAGDFSGSRSAMAQLFRWVRANYLGNSGRGAV